MRKFKQVQANRQTPFGTPSRFIRLQEIQLVSAEKAAEEQRKGEAKRKARLPPRAKRTKSSTNDSAASAPRTFIVPIPGCLDIYTDGSHIKGSFVRGWGAYAQWQGKAYQMSGCGNNLAEEISNPTLELMAAVRVLEFMRGRFPLGVERVRLIADYIGVRAYGSYAWNPDKSVKPCFRTQARWLREVAQGYNMDHIERKIGCPALEFVHVRGHCGIEGNEHADRLAKSNAEFNSFADLRVDLLH